MESIKISLRDNDQVVRATSALLRNGNEDSFKRFLQKINEEMIPGQTAYLEIEGIESGPMRFEISHSE